MSPSVVVFNVAHTARLHVTASGVVRHPPCRSPHSVAQRGSCNPVTPEKSKTSLGVHRCQCKLETELTVCLYMCMGAPNHYGSNNKTGIHDWSMHWRYTNTCDCNDVRHVRSMWFAHQVSTLAIAQKPKVGTGTPMTFVGSRSAAHALTSGS